MLNRTIFAVKAFKPVVSPVYNQQRNMATLKEIAMRLKSIKSIQKITKSMKMVSAAKFARAERALKAGKSFGSSPAALSQAADLTVPEDTDNKLLVAISSDRGLCGGCHSTISKRLRPMLESDKDSKLVIVGDKVRGQLARQYKDRFVFCVTDYGKKPPAFGEASAIATQILANPGLFQVGNIVFNKFVSAISYDCTLAPIFSSDAMTSTDKLINYECEDDTLQAYQEFHLANSLFIAMLQGAASEQSARMNAMENASKNAGEMIDKLSLLYNRTRQAVITNELIEIISGASAV